MSITEADCVDALKNAGLSNLDAEQTVTEMPARTSGDAKEGFRKAMTPCGCWIKTMKGRLNNDARTC